MNSSRCFNIRTRFVSPASPREMAKFLTPREKSKEFDFEIRKLMSPDPFNNLIKGENLKLQPVILKHKKEKATKNENLKSIALKTGKCYEKEVRNQSFLPSLKNEKKDKVKYFTKTFKCGYKKGDSTYLKEANKKAAEQKLLKSEPYLEVSFGSSNF